MTRDDVLGVVVSYNGGPSLAENVLALREQVGRVCVVDNGSGPATAAVLEELARQPRTEVLRLGSNQGIGRALNAGVERARQGGFAWLLTMDQDSLPAPTLVAAYAGALTSRPDLTCLTPVLSSRDGQHAKGGDGPVAYAITSGNLVAVRLFDVVGLYDPDLFIDCVDFDFSLRLRAAGHGIHRVAEAHMRHQLGEPSRLAWPWRRLYARHPPIRRYYMTRNYLYLAERHLLRFPLFILKLGALQAVLSALAVVFDPEALRSCRAMGYGVLDWLLRRKGPAPRPDL